MGRRKGYRKGVIGEGVIQKEWECDKWGWVG